MPFRILTVCTGNICRSPAMHLLLAHELAGDERFAVSSAGTHAEVGWPVHPPMDRMLIARGIDVEGFSARQADRHMLEESGLILTATQQHRGWVAERDPRTVRRVFTFTEFADATTGAPAGLESAELVAWAASHRPAVRVRSIGAATRRGYDEGDILDPYGRGDAAFTAALLQIDPLVQRVARVLKSCAA
ncbi:arsenate reductase/protein-tyrosine-phosphatase family protein [Leifsonia sp. 22587]|uniref:arsenate reductase/protein-tyrosine-phosphatase family protein n=1 Tax=Leifsonia sp. 22587 TaxID=3453946 RepID=UPI003F8599E4